MADQVFTISGTGSGSDSLSSLNKDLTLTDSGTGIETYLEYTGGHFDGFAGLFIWDPTPLPPSGLQLTDYSTYIEVEFNTSSTQEVERYEIWRSQDSAETKQDFDLIAEFSEKLWLYPNSIKYEDYSTTKKGTKYYKIYAIAEGYYSDPLLGNISFTDDVGDVSNFTVSGTVDVFVLNWDMPDDLRLEKVQLKADHDASSGNLSEGSSVQIYEGLGTTFTFKVPSEYRDDYYQFWIYTVTRT